MKQRIQLSDHFTFSRLIRFVLPSIAMMLCTSLYSIVDGFFVSNYVGKTSFAAVNLMMPVLMAVAAIGFMIGTGGTAIVARKLCEGEKENANRYFSMLVYVGILLSTIVSVAGFVFMPSIALLLKADGKLLEDSVLYGRILFAFLPASALQNIFQAFFVTAEKPHLSFRFSVGAGLANMLLDYLFVGVFEWGLAGAAVATGIGQIIGGILPLIYFAVPNNSLLRLVKTGFESRVLLQSFGNGSSEMVSTISSSIVGIFYNYQLLRFAGEDGVAAYGVIMYVNFIFAAIFIGYAIGSAPLVSYHYGAENHTELRNLYRKSLSLIGIVGVVMFALSELLSSPLVGLYVSYDKELFDMTVNGFRIYSTMFLILGFNIWGSSFFTALGNGVVSALISFLRTLVFQLASLILLPELWHIDGVWWSAVVAEVLALVLTVFFLVCKKKKYHYA